MSLSYYWPPSVDIIKTYDGGPSWPTLSLSWYEWSLSFWLGYKLGFTIELQDWVKGFGVSVFSGEGNGYERGNFCVAFFPLYLWITYNSDKEVDELVFGPSNDGFTMDITGDWKGDEFV